MEFGTRKGMRPLASVLRMTAAIEPLGLALVELVIADRSDHKSYHRQRVDRRLVVNIGDENGLAPMRSPAATKIVFLWVINVAMYSAPPAATVTFLCPVLGITDADAARRRPEICHGSR